MWRPVAVVLLIVLGVVGPAGCGSDHADPVGAWGVSASGLPHLTLARGGKVTGNDGCNSLVGTWTARGETVTFSAMVATKMHCEGIHTWLSHLSTATVDGDTLTIADSAGNRIGRLDRR